MLNGSEQRVARTLQSKYWLARCRSVPTVLCFSNTMLQLRAEQTIGLVPRQGAILMLCYMMRSLRCTLQSCLDLYGFWRSTGESLDGGGEDGSKPPTGGVLAQSPCQADPGSVRDKEELKQRSSNRDRSDEEADDPQGDRDHVMEWRQKDSRLRPCVPCCVANDVRTVRYGTCEDLGMVDL
ncbi:hypothetical protein LB503_000972, partial [Fusarium chuoi]